MLVIEDRAGMQANTIVPSESSASAIVGSRYIWFLSTAWKNCQRTKVRHGSLPTAEHDVTSPNISIPASASAVLAAIDPDAMHPSIPSFSIMDIKTSMVDLGKSSRQTDDTMAWWTAIAMDRSSAS